MIGRGQIWNIFKEVLERNHADLRKEGAHSYNYKINTR